MKISFQACVFLQNTIWIPAQRTSLPCSHPWDTCANLWIIFYCFYFHIFSATVEPGEDPDVVRAKYFIRDEFLVSTTLSHNRVCRSGGHFWDYMSYLCNANYFPAMRPDSRFAPSHWEMVLQSNAASHWLDTNQDSALCSSFEDGTPVYVICGYPIFKWVAGTWLHDRVPG